MRLRTFRLLQWLFIVGGIAIGRFLSAFQHLEIYKVLNIIGLLYGLAGVIVLLEVVSSKERLRRFIVEDVSFLLMAAHFTVPFGVMAAAVALAVFDAANHPSALAVLFGSQWFLGLSLLPMFFIEDFVSVPKRQLSKDTVTRNRIFGASLIVSGLFVQLIAAFKDLLAT